KTAKIRQRNVAALPGRQLSTAVDNRPSPDPTPRPPTVSADSVLEDRFCEVIATFTGDLGEAEIEGLRTWIGQNGVAAVWAALGPLFRTGPAAVRADLRQRLREAIGPAE